MRFIFAIGSCVLLAACASTSAPVSEQTTSSEQSQSKNVVTWKEYKDTDLRISFSYPEFVGDAANFDCDNHRIPLKVFRQNERVIVAQEYFLKSDCSVAIEPTNSKLLSQPLPAFPFETNGAANEKFYDSAIAGSLLNIWMTSVSSQKELLSFLKQVYGPACTLDTEREDMISATEHHLFLTADPTLAEKSSFCGDQRIYYNPKTGAVVTFFMPLKTAMIFSTPDHRGSFDSEIANSFRFEE